MTKSSSHNRKVQGHHVILTQTQKFYSIALLVIIVIISYLPTSVGKLTLVDNYVSKNDLLLFLVLPFLQCFLMLICPILAVRISPKLSAFDTPWIEKSDAELICFILFLLLILVSRPIIIFLTKQMRLPFTQQIMFGSSIGTNTIFLIAVTFIVTLVVPITEEIFWRGYAQARLETVFGSETALFTQATAYAVLHFRPIGGFFTVFAYGLIFGLWRQKRKTLLPIIIMHIIINSTSFAGRWYYWIDLIK